MDSYLKSELDLIQEFFAIPVGLKEVVRIDSTPLYSSNKLIAKYKHALIKHKQFRGSEKIINSLINRGLILPVFMNKGIMHLTIYKIFANVDIKSMCGFYSPNDNIIIIALDNNMTLGWVSANFMGKLTAHELTHMAATHMKKGFLSLFLPELKAFYARVFYNLTGCKELLADDGGKIIEDYATNLFVKSEMAGKPASKAVIQNFNKTMNDIHATYKSSNEDLISSQMVIEEAHEKILSAYFRRGLDGIIDYMQSNSAIVRFLLGSLYDSYVVFNKTTPSVFPIQEFFYPSEVICVKTEISNDAKYKKAWSKIK